MKELAIKVLNQLKTNTLEISDLHELLVQYGKFKTNSLTVEKSADNIIEHFIKDPTNLEELERKELVNKLTNLGLKQIIEDLEINTVLTKEGKEIYV